MINGLLLSYRMNKQNSPLRSIFSLWVAGCYRLHRRYCDDSRDIWNRDYERIIIGSACGRDGLIAVRRVGY